MSSFSNTDKDYWILVHVSGSIFKPFIVQNNSQPAGQVIMAIPSPVLANVASPVAMAAVPSGSAQSSTGTSTSVAYETNRVAKASAGILYGVAGYNSLASAQFIQFHDAAALPADAAVPVFILSVAATSNFSVDFGSYGRPFLSGIVICNSTTGPTKTIGAANCWFDARYV